MLAWYEKESSDIDSATPLSPKSTQTLYELEMPTEPERCYLYLRDGPDSPPIKVSSETEGQTVGLATAVTTSPSSYAMNNNTSSSWSATHYSNKSDTGMQCGGRWALVGAAESKVGQGSINTCH